jgi:hypothetical protein
MALTPLSNGCKSPFAAAYHTEGVVIHTVDSAMKAWADYVNAGNATSSEVTMVQNYYQQYYIAQQVAKNAFELTLAVNNPDTQEKYRAAVAAVSDASKTIIDFVAAKIRGTKGGAK